MPMGRPLSRGVSLTRKSYPLPSRPAAPDFTWGVQPRIAEITGLTGQHGASSGSSVHLVEGLGVRPVQIGIARGTQPRCPAGGMVGHSELCHLWHSACVTSHRVHHTSPSRSGTAHSAGEATRRQRRCRVRCTGQEPGRRRAGSSERERRHRAAFPVDSEANDRAELHRARRAPSSAGCVRRRPKSRLRTPKTGATLSALKRSSFGWMLSRPTLNILVTFTSSWLMRSPSCHRREDRHSEGQLGDVAVHPRADHATLRRQLPGRTL